MNPSESIDLPDYGVWKGEAGSIIVLTRMLTDPTVAEFLKTLDIKKQFKNCNGLLTVFVLE